MHPWVQMPVPIDEKYKDKFIDVGTYPNINDLFYITDLLITDYSSNIFEYSLMKKPMLFFAYDEIQYSFSRGFHRDYKESTPGKIVHNFKELLSAIENNDFEYEKVQEYIDEHFDYIDSNASDRVIDWLILDDMPEEFKKSIDNKFKDAQKTAVLDFEPELDEEATEDFD
jgi:CDP-ribitol ribitolphosphotransferase